MAHMVIAVYDSFTKANRALKDLSQHMVSREKIQIKSMKPSDGKEKSLQRKSSTPVPDGKRAGASVGAGIGSAIGISGGLLASIGSFSIPAVVLLSEAGIFGVALLAITGAGLGAAAGGATGGFLGALIGIGIPVEEARVYANGVQFDGIKVIVKADEAEVVSIRRVLKKHKPTDLIVQSKQHHEQRWVGS
jgi:hypothetical protein